MRERKEKGMKEANKIKDKKDVLKKYKEANKKEKTERERER